MKGEDLCYTWADIDTVKPGSKGIKLASLLTKLVEESRHNPSQCHQQQHGPWYYRIIIVSILF